MQLDFINLGSGSSGNCTWLEYGQVCLLVDAGFSRTELEKRIIDAGKDPARVKGILVSHGHGDHISGIRLFSKKYHVPVYCNELTRREICCCVKSDEKFVPEFKVFRTGDPFSIDGIAVRSFQVCHDTADPVAFLFQVGPVRLGVVTDLGMVTPLVKERLKGVYGLLFESNHDVGLLRQSKRSWSLKQRILSNSGHLSNEQSAGALREIVSDGLKELVLGHLSSECNRSELAFHTTQNALQNTDIHIQVASQQAITRILPEGFSV